MVVVHHYYKNKNNNSDTDRYQRLAKRAVMSIAAGQVARLAIDKGREIYNNRKKETSQPSVYDNVMSFFGFNKKPVSVDTCKAELDKVKEELNNAKKNSAEVDQCKAELNKIKDELNNAKKNGAEVDQCKAELNKLKEQLNNAKKNGAEVDQCKSELNKINNELQKYKNVLDDYKKYESIIEQKYKELESDNKQLIDQLKKSESDNKQLIGKYNYLKAEITTQDSVIRVLKEKQSKLEQQNAAFQKQLVTK